MSAPESVLLLAGALIACLILASMEVRWTRRVRAASLRLEAEAKAREAAKPYGNVDVDRRGVWAAGCAAHLPTVIDADEYAEAVRAPRRFPL